MNMKSKRDSLCQEAVLNAWSELSGDFQWTENLLVHYQDKLDWHKISSNRNIFWTIPMVQKFRNSIDWDIFSLNAGAECLTEKFINAFKDDWNWSNLADNYYLEISYELLDKFVDKWDWKRIIARFHYHDMVQFKEAANKSLPGFLAEKLTWLYSSVMLLVLT